MKPSEIETSALEFITNLTDTVIRIAHASVNGPTVDPAYMIVASMFNAGQLALSQYSNYTVVTL